MENEIVKRWQATTPKFWKKVQRVAIIAGTVAGVILTAPVSLPAAVVTAAGYVATISATMATLSQLTVGDSKTEEK
jgi:hypothetical protein